MFGIAASHFKMLLALIFSLLLRACLAQVSMSCAMYGNSYDYAYRTQPALLIVTFHNCGTLVFDSSVVSDPASLFKVTDAVDGRPVPVSLSTIGSTVRLSLVGTPNSFDAEPRTGRKLNVTLVPYFVSVLSCSSCGELPTLTCQAEDFSSPVIVRTVYSPTAKTLCVQFSENVTSPGMPSNSLVLSPGGFVNTAYLPFLPGPNNSSLIYCSVFPNGWSSGTKTVTASRQITAFDLAGNLHLPIAISVPVHIERPLTLLSMTSSKIYDMDSNGKIDACYVSFLWPVRTQVFTFSVSGQNLITCSINTTHAPQISHFVLDEVGVLIRFFETESGGSAALGLAVSSIPLGTSLGNWRQRFGLPDGSGGTLFLLPWNYTAPISIAVSDKIARDVAPGVAIFATANTTDNTISYIVSESTSTFTSTVGNQAPMIVDLQTLTHHFTTSVSATTTSNIRSAPFALDSSIFNSSMYVLVIPFAFNLGTSAPSEGRLLHYLPFSNQ